MNPHSALHGLVATAALAAGLAHGPLAHAQAPGEDPVVLTKKLTVNMQPTGGAAAPGQLDNNGAMPSWLRARIARYEAKAFAGDSSGIRAKAAAIRASTRRSSSAPSRPLGPPTTNSWVVGSRSSASADTASSSPLSG